MNINISLPLFKGQTFSLTVVPAYYRSPRNPALELVDANDGEPFMTCTTNTSERLTPNTIAIKTWSENEGIAMQLIKAGLIKPTVIDFIPSGFVKIEVYEMTQTLIDLFTAEASK